MTGDLERFELRPRQDITLAELTQTILSPGVTDEVRLQRNEDGLTVQLSGTATEIIAIVERATNVELGNWAPAGDPFDGNLSLGMPPRQYHEPGRGFWRVRVASISGGSATVVISGEEG